MRLKQKLAVLGMVSALTLVPTATKAEAAQSSGSVGCQLSHGVVVAADQYRLYECTYAYYGRPSWNVQLVCQNTLSWYFPTLAWSTVKIRCGSQGDFYFFW